MQTDNATPWAITDTLDGLVTLAWTTFIGTDVVRVDSRELGDRVVCSSISISGPSSATVLFFTDSALAHAGASTVLDIPAGELTDADVHDVMGEIVNIIGGNLKGVVSDEDSEWSLTLPVVSNAMQTSPGARLAAEVHFLTEGGIMGCQIFEHR